MPDEHETVGEARIREAIQSFAAAFRAKDIDGVMSLFAPTIISFDLAPPLRCVGAEALRKHWEAMFASLQGPVAYEIHDLAIEVSDRLAFSHSLNRMRGTLQDGRATERWLRWTVCFRLIDGRWQATHEHVSVPIEVASDKALFDLAP